MVDEIVSANQSRYMTSPYWHLSHCTYASTNNLINKLNQFSFCEDSRYLNLATSPESLIVLDLLLGLFFFFFFSL